MSVQSEIDRINANVANTYAALNAMGATMPEQQNSNNLPSTARTVPQSGGSSVQSDWNQNDETQPDFIKNRPFGESPTGGDTLTWDGNTEGRYTYDMMGTATLCHVSDVVLDVDDFADGVYVRAVGGNETHFSVNQCFEIAPGMLSMEGMYFISVSKSVAGTTIEIEEDGEVMTLEYPKNAGTYFVISFPGIVIEYMKIPGYTGFPVTKKVDSQYLPGAVFLYTDLTYLYNTEDVSDSANRTTRAKLMEAVQSGRNVFVAVGTTSIIYLAVKEFEFSDEAGHVTVSADGAELTFYTAEYTAS